MNATPLDVKPIGTGTCQDGGSLLLYAHRIALGVLPFLGTVAVATVVTVTDSAPNPVLSTPQPNGDPVLIDFLAVDPNGKPVKDLKLPEVQLKINGRVRPIVSLQVIDFSQASVGSLGELREGVPPPFGTNALDSGRSVVIFIDDDSIRPGRERDTLAAAEALIASLPSHARVVIATPHGGWKTKLTADRAEVRRVLGDIVGRAFAADDLECRTRATLEGVRATLALFSADAAPTVLIISGGLAGPRQNLPAGSSSLSLGQGRAQVPFRPCDLRIEDFLKVRDATARTRAHVYVIRPEDVAVLTNMDQLSATPSDTTAGLSTLAALADSDLRHLTPSGRNPLIEAAQESSAYYLVGFAPTAAEAGAAHRIDVQVTRARVNVLRRPEIVIEKAIVSTRALASTPPEMLRDPRTRRELLLRIAGYPSRGFDPDTPVRVIVFAEPVGAGGFESAAAGLFDQGGRLVSEWISTGDVSFGTLIAALPVSPGAYRLRVAVRDATGRSGTADYLVDATLASAGPLRLGAIVLGVPANGGMRPVLQFAGESVAIACLDIYGETNGKPIDATLEVAETVTGPAVLTLPLRVVSNDADSFVATALIPIAGLTAGDYVVRGTVNLQDRPQGRVVRTLRKR